MSDLLQLQKLDVTPDSRRYAAVWNKYNLARYVHNLCYLSNSKFFFLFCFALCACGSVILKVKTKAGRPLGLTTYSILSGVVTSAC